MSQPPSYQQPTHYQPQPYQPPPSNGLGVAGFVVSLVGVLLGGVLSPIGLLLSFIAVFRRPRGFAIAGIIVGLIGSLEVILILAFFGFMGFACLNVGTTLRPVVQTGAAMAQAQQKVAEFKSAHAGKLPTEAEGTALVSGINDGWGHALRYEVRNPTSYDIRSAGPDGTFGTQDDIQTQAQ